MVYDKKFGPDNNFLGIEIMLIAPPGSFQGKFAGLSNTITDPIALDNMGLEGASRLYYRPIMVTKELFPMIFPSVEQSLTYNGQQVFKDDAKSTGSVAKKLGFVRKDIAQEISATTRMLEEQGLQRFNIARLRNEIMTSKFLAKQLDLRAPAVDQHFDTARFDMNIEDAIELEILPPYLAFIKDKNQVIPRSEQIHDGIIDSRTNTIKAVKTLRELETLMAADSAVLSAFKPIKDNPAITAGIKDAANEGIKAFNALCENENIRTSAPYAKPIFNTLDI